MQEFHVSQVLSVTHIFCLRQQKTVKVTIDTGNAGECENDLEVLGGPTPVDQTRLTRRIP